MEGDGVTVVVPNWNHELLLPRSVSSALAAVRVLGGLGVPADILVIDDGSRDGSPTLLRQLEALYHDDGLRVLVRAANGGLAAARNLGLERARHRYVLFLDADNELLPQNVPLFRQALVDTGAAAAYGTLLVRTMAGSTACGAISNESFQNRIFRGNYIDAFAMVDRLQLLDAGGYSAHCPAVEDYEQWLHLACNGRGVLFVPAVMGYYYVLAKSMITEIHSGRTQARVERVFDQLGSREHLTLPTHHLRYHPLLGHL